MDHYQTLGVERTATADEIKRAYRKLASKFHPDREGGDTTQFQRIEEAYRTLSDDSARARYDSGDQQFFDQNAGFGFFRQNFTGIDDFFAQFTNSKHNQSKVYTCTVAVTLEQVAGGLNEALHLQTPTGTKIVQISVPKGVEHGQQIRYSGIMPDGWLQVRFLLQPHSRFTREGINLHSVVNVSVFDLILGCIVHVFTLTGKKLEVEIKPRTKPNTQMRLIGHGLEKSDLVGDHIILLSAYIPDTISESTIDAIRQEQKIQKEFTNEQQSRN